MPGGLRARGRRDHRHRQPHRPEAHGRGRLRPRAATRVERGRGAARRHAARAEGAGDAGYYPGGHDSSPPRLSERRDPAADGVAGGEAESEGEDMGDTVGFIGLGTMGMPMATNLSRAGVRLVVYDASPMATTDVRRLAGVTVAESPAQVAAQSDVLFSCLPNNDIVLGVY